MPEQFGDKSHEATPHRRQEARERGQVARSQDLASAALLVVATLAMMWLGSRLVNTLGNLAGRQLGGQAWLAADPQFANSLWNAVVGELAMAILPILGTILAAAVAVHLMQVGFLFLPQKVAVDVSHISPIKGFQRLFSVTSAARLGFGIFKIVVVATVAVWALWSQSGAILALYELEVPQIALFLAKITLETTLKIGLALLVLALGDYLFQRWKHEKDLRMTTQEIRDELKNLQGDPQMAARRRAVQRQIALQRMSTAVPKADVIVTNPTELAVAIQYDPLNMPAPIVVAKGSGTVAERIRRLALEHSVPVVEKKPLAQFLFKNVEIGQPVPAEQYAAVAELLRYVYELKGKTLPDLNQAA